MTGGCGVKEEREQLGAAQPPPIALLPQKIAPVILSVAKDLVAIPLQ